MRTATPKTSTGMCASYSRQDAFDRYRTAGLGRPRHSGPCKSLHLSGHGSD
jgi:hypothetical protein